MICMEKSLLEIEFLCQGPKSSGAVDLYRKNLARNLFLSIFGILWAGGRWAVAPTLTPLVSTNPPKIAIPLLGGITPKVVLVTRGDFDKIERNGIPWGPMGPKSSAGGSLLPSSTQTTSAVVDAATRAQ